MTIQTILQLIQHDADSFQLTAADALVAFAEILNELAERISADDLTTLIAIGSVLHREAFPNSAKQTTPRLQLVEVASEPCARSSLDLSMAVGSGS